MRGVRVRVRVSVCVCNACVWCMDEGGGIPFPISIFS